MIAVSNTVASWGARVEKPTAWATVFSAFLRIQKELMAQLFEVCQFPVSLAASNLSVP